MDEYCSERVESEHGRSSCFFDRLCDFDVIVAVVTGHTANADALVLFGITGDLARKKLFSALYALTVEGRLDVPVVGVASSDWDDDKLKTRAREALGDVDDSDFSKLEKNLSYISGDYRNETTYSALASSLESCELPVFYLAIPPGLFDDVVEGLASAELTDRGRVVLEKPFGRDLGSARELDGIVHRYFTEDRVYRIDHFLGKDAIQNLMIFRFSNTILEPIWNRHYISGVQITLAEDFGVEGRGAFYDEVGAIRDVVQNHLLQVLSLLAMEPPVSDEPDALRDERVKVLKAVRSVGPGDVIRGRYDGYLEEAGVKLGSTTETYVAARFEIDSWRWAGVPWVIRAGKGLKRTVTEAVVEFREPPRPLFADPDCHPGPNRLVFRTKPDDDIVLSLQAKLPGSEMVSGPIDLHLAHDRLRGQDGYGRLLADALKGDQSLFARQDGVMEAWRIVEGILDLSDQPHRYPREGWGPEEANRLLDGWEWITE